MDLTEDFDIVNRDALWRILGEIGCRLIFVSSVKQLHIDMKVRLTFNGSLLDETAADNGIKECDILAPIFFSIYFALVTGRILDI